MRRHPDQRFDEKIEMSSDGCWLWRGAKADGYGMFQVRTKLTIRAHRYSFERYRGAIPDGLQLDHLCRNRACVNPYHLDPVTCRVNLLRGHTLQAANVAKTHCPSGHPYSAENTKIKGNRRVCRSCSNAADLRRYHARKRHVA